MAAVAMSQQVALWGAGVWSHVMAEGMPGHVQVTGFSWKMPPAPLALYTKCYCLVLILCWSDGHLLCPRER